MVDFQNVASGDYVPNSTGLVLSISGLPGSTPKTPVPMEIFFTVLGNVGTGNPVFKGQVQLIQGGTWYDVSGATVTDNGSATFYCFGVAARIAVPTLTSPGTTTTAPRVLVRGRNLLVPSSLPQPVALVGEAKFSNDLGTTSEVLSVPGYFMANPNVPGRGTPYKNLAFVTQEGAGTSFIEGTYRDGDGAFKVKESASLAGANGQAWCFSYAEELHVDFTDGTGTTDVWLNNFQFPI